MKIEPPPLTSPPTDDEIAAARTVVRLNRHLAHALAKVELTEAQYRVLAMLEEGDAVASGIAGQMALTKPSITALVDGLEDRGLVERLPHPSDRRRRTLSITPDGLAQLERADEATTACLRAIAEHTDDAASPVAGLAAWDRAIRGYRRAKHEARAERGGR
ncbi:MAG: MarR family transcriptional regulator [Actinomycetota bacterium]